MMKTYKIPKQERVYAIGDVHGYAALLDALHEKITQDMAENPPRGSVHIVYSGDYIDRGPDSAGVIARLIEAKKRDDGISRIFLKGNHEWGMQGFMKRPVGHDWLRYGGQEALESYGVNIDHCLLMDGELEKLPARMKDEIPQAHFDFLEQLEIFRQIGDYVFAHAGVDPYKPLAAQEPRDFMCIRQPFLSYHKQPDFKPLDFMVVHGHSPSMEPIIRPHRIGVDTGVYMRNVLTCAVLEGQDVRFLQVR